MLRRMIAALAALLLVVAILTHRREIGALVEALARARPEWLAAALLLQAASVVCLATVFRRTLAAVAVVTRLATACGTLLATFAANLLAPSAGAAGMALWVDVLGRRGAPRPRVVAGVLAGSLLDALALALLVVIAAARVAAERPLAPVEVASAATLAALIAVGAAAIAIAARRPQWWARRLADAQALAARVAARWSRWRPDPRWPERTAALAGDAAAALLSRADRLAVSLLLALAEHAASAAALAAVALAFGQTLAPLALGTAYALAMLAWVASPVPQGIGVVELVLTGTLTLAGVPAPAAALIAVTHRGITFWIPLAVGFLLLWRLETAPPPPA
jgi:uncharacterized protein (TIRG00374 family)